MTIVRKNFVNKIVVDYKIDLINYSNLMLLEIEKLNARLKRLERKTPVVIAYYSQIRRSCI